MTAGAVASDLMAAAYLSRVAEPGTPAIWHLVRRLGLQQAADAIRVGDVDADVLAATAARRDSVDPQADLDAAAAHGIRLLVPSSDEWPTFALAPFGRRSAAPGSPPLPVPPIALWVRGRARLGDVTVRSVAVVGSRASTAYGEHIASDWAYALAALGVTVVSGGAYGIDAAAHRGALAAGGVAVLVSAGGLDRPYPTGNAALFDRVSESGVLVSECPPGTAPQRHRFLSRNRLIAGFGTATLIVESARRSGALNTARHARELGRPLLAVPGPVTSALSAGCHALIRRDDDPAVLVTTASEVAEWCGASYEAHEPTSDGDDGAESAHADRRARLDALSADAAAVLDGFPARGSVTETVLSRLSGRAVPVVLRSLPALLDAGLVEAVREGYRLVR